MPNFLLGLTLPAVQLKILACNVSGGTLSGAINMNGRPLNPKELRRQSTIVWQRDLLLSTATVCLAI